MTKRATQEGISVAELIRRRFDSGSSDDDVALAELTAELRRAVTSAKRSLAGGLAEARAVLADLRASSPAPDAEASAKRPAGKRTVRA